MLEGGRRWESFPAISPFTSSSNSSTTSSPSTPSSANSPKRRHPRAPRFQHRVAQSSPSPLPTSTALRIHHLLIPPASLALNFLSPRLLITVASPFLSPVPLSLLRETRRALLPPCAPPSPLPLALPFLRGSLSFCSAGRVLEDPL